MEDGGNGGIDRHLLILGQADVPEVPVEAMEVDEVVKHLVPQGPLLLMLLRQAVAGHAPLCLG